jgi:dihydroorotate dehydrogenase (NAD+) catalytic subunit
MADLRVSVCGLDLRNPVLPAAGPPVRDGAAMVACAEGGAGGLVSKTISVRPATVPTPNMAEVSAGFLNTELWSELPIERWISQELPLARESGLPIIVSLGYAAADIAELAPRVRAYADAVELSTHYIGENPQPMMAAIRAAKDALDVPVLVKLSPLGREIVDAAQAACEAGADGLVLINSFGPCLGIDIETALPLMGSTEGYGWLSGAALRPLALRCVYDVARSVALPIFGVGGLARGEDAIEMMMVGASAVQVCTAAILRGPSVFGRMAAEMGTWLDAHGYSSIAEVQGLTLRKVTEKQLGTGGRPPLLDLALCTGCRLCEISCAYDAIRVVEKRAVLDAERCTGCGLCVSRCRPRALRMVRGEAAAVAS